MNSKKEKSFKLIDENGIRIDGRKFNELRKIKMEIGVLDKADGSAYIEHGGNKILVAVYGPREAHPKHISLPDRAVIRCRYHMAPFSTEERKSPAPSRREIELSKVIREALEPAIIASQYPRTTIDIFIEVLQSDGGTRCAGITGASLALADAGIPMKSLVSACAVGKVNGEIAITSSLEFIFKGRLVNVMLNDPGSVSNFGFNELDQKDKELIKSSDFVCVFNWAQNLKGTNLIKKVFTLLKKDGKGKSYLDTGDPSYKKNKIKDLINEVMKKPIVDVLSINENEALQYASFFDKKILKHKLKLEEKAFLGAKILHEELSLRIDLHTSKYSASFMNGESYIVPSFKVKPLRVTGAGDVWNAANIYGEALKLKPEERLLIANALACSYISSLTVKTISLKNLITFLKRIIKKEVKFYPLKKIHLKVNV